MSSTSELRALLEAHGAEIEKMMKEQREYSNEISRLQSELSEMNINTKPEENEDEEDCLELEEYQGEDPFTLEDEENSVKRADKEGETKTRRSIIRCTGDLFRFPPLSSLKNRTLSLYAVSKVVDDNTHFMSKLFVALACLAFTCVQLYFLLLIIAESSHPKCNSMSDCPSGTFCELDNFHLPTCSDCSRVNNFDANWIVNNCPSKFAANEWEKFELHDIDHNVLWVKRDSDPILLNCLAYQHCQSTELDIDTNFKGHCDFVALNRSRMDAGSWLLIVFLALLWALPVSRDIEESAVEERILDLGVDGINSIPAYIICLSLRLRRFYLSLLATSTTLALILTDDISTKNIILNFLSITFILEADNVLGALFLTSYHRKMINHTVESIKVESLRNATAVFFGARIQGLFCVVVLFVSLGYVDKTVDNCDNLADFMWDIGFYCFFVTVFVHGISKLLDRRYIQSPLIQVVYTLSEVVRNLFAIEVSIMITGGLYYSKLPFWTVFPLDYSI
jgi:hypothetical protein